ncbi:hypothetical protein ACJRO7_027680, partial [Eucalyptus globulus]
MSSHDCQVRYTPSVRVSDLQCVLSHEGGLDLESDPSSRSGGEELVVARGLVDAKSAGEGGARKRLRQNVLVSQDSNDRAMIARRTQT